MPGSAAAVAPGGAAVDAGTGLRSDGKDGAELMADAMVDLSNERLGGSKFAKTFGRKGGQKSRRKLTKAQARAMVRARTAKRAAMRQRLALP